MSVSYVLNAKLVFMAELSTAKYLQFMLFTGIGVIVIQTTVSLIFEGWAQTRLNSINIFENNEVNIFIANSLVRISGVIFSLSWNFLFYKKVVFKKFHM